MSKLEIRPLRPDEIDQFAMLSHYAFAGRAPSQRTTDFERRARPERNALVAVEDGEIISQMMIYEFGVWIDGQRFAAGGLANVATTPERARRGYASRLIRESLRWMREEMGLTLATLYATVHPLYRGLGWALAADGFELTGAPTAFQPSGQVPSDPGGRVVRRLAELDDRLLLEPVYRAFAQPRSGYMDRPRWYWEDQVLRSEHATRQRWLGLWYASDGGLAGYVLYTLNNQPLDPQNGSELRVYELVALRPEGYHALLTFLASHHLWRRVVIPGGRDVPWTSLVANPHGLDIWVPVRQHFMLRVLDARQAIAQRRGHASTESRDVVLRIDDDAAPWNAGTWLIGDRDGRWVCEEAAPHDAQATVDAATLAALFSGYLSTDQAIESGTLRATDDARPTLKALLTTTYPPYSGDHF